MKTSGYVYLLGLYVNHCCDEELIFDAGDTFSRCPHCGSECHWELDEAITRESDLMLVA